MAIPKNIEKTLVEFLVVGLERQATFVLAIAKQSYEKSKQHLRK